MPKINIFRTPSFQKMRIMGKMLNINGCLVVLTAHQQVNVLKAHILHVHLLYKLLAAPTVVQGKVLEGN